MCLTSGSEGMQKKSLFNTCLWQLSIRKYKEFFLTSRRQGWEDSFKPPGASKHDQEHLKDGIAHGAIHVVTHQGDEACQWLMVVADHILLQLLCPMGSLPLAGEAPAAAGGPENPVQLLPYGEKTITSRYTPFFLILFFHICNLSFPKISNFNKLWSSSNVFFFKAVTMYANSLTCKDVTETESQGLV